MGFRQILFYLCFSFFITAYGAPIARHMVDMTHSFGKDTLYRAPMKKFEMDVVINGSFDFGGFELWMQSEQYATSAHTGTHMDAPAHVGHGGTTVDNIPISTLVAPAAVIDITEKANTNPDAEITIEDLTHWEDITGHSLDGTVILLRFGWGHKWENKTAYYGSPTDELLELHFPGLSGEACLWLVENRKVLGVGSEGMSFDKGTTVTWPCHRYLMGSGIYGLENVANVDKLPLYGATVYVMPIKLRGGSGGPTRIIATYPEVMFKNN